MDFVNVMAYDVYWTGYDFNMDIEGLQALGIPKGIHTLLAKSNLLKIFSKGYSELSNKSGGWYKHGGLRVSKK